MSCRDCGSVHHATSEHAAILIRYRNQSKLNWARKAQNDQAVANNIAAISADLLPLWDRVKKTIKGSIDERTEAFLQLAHDRQAEVLAAVIEDADAKVEALIAERDARDAVYSDVVPF